VAFLSCVRTTHSLWFKFKLTFFIIYFVINFLFSLVITGGLFAAMNILFGTVFKDDHAINDYVPLPLIGYLFKTTFALLCFLTMIASLTQRVESAKKIYNLLAVLFGIMLTGLFAFMAYFLATLDCWGPDMFTDKSKLSLFIMFVSGCIILSSYFIPILFRPLDFLFNFPHYVIGLMAYIFLTPTYSIVFGIYSFCNLHDISWGNRPATDIGMNTLTADKKRQEEMKDEYEVFRSYALFFWILINIFFAVGVSVLPQFNYTTPDG
jgi:chitin synthase